MYIQLPSGAQSLNKSGSITKEVLVSLILASKLQTMQICIYIDVNLQPFLCNIFMHIYGLINYNNIQLYIMQY